MTKSQFAALKKGFMVYLPSLRGSNRCDCREVTGIDRLFGKISVVAANKPYSYRYVMMKPCANETCGSIMGVCHSSTSW